MRKIIIATTLLAAGIAWAAETQCSVPFGLRPSGASPLFVG